jgi:hypothetical protein
MVLAVVAGVLVIAAVAGGLLVVATRSGGTSATPAPAAPAASAAVPSQSWTDEQRALEARLDPRALTACRPNPSPAGGGVTAALFCTTTDTRQQVAVFGYGDAASLRSDVATRAAGVAGDGRCETGGSEIFTWDTGPDTPAGGTVICDTRDGQHFLFWTSDDDLVAFLSYGSDPRELFDWWEAFQPFPDTTGTAANPARPA